MKTLSIMATLFWVEAVWMGRRRREQRRAWRKQIFEVPDLEREVRGPAGAIMCQTRDLGRERPQRHTLLPEEQVAVDMGGLPAGHEEDAAGTSQDGLLEEMGSQTRV